MAVFSTNQNRQLYVAKAYNATVNDASTVGTIGGVKVVDGALHFLYKGADNTLKSDCIQLKNLDYTKVIAAADMVTPLKSFKVSLDADVNSGNIVAGQDYVLRICLNHWIGMSEYDTYFKDAVVHGVSGMTATQFYQKMKESLDASFSREIGASKSSNPYLSFTASADGLTITEKEQEWRLGIQAQLPVLFTPQPTTILFQGVDVVWGKVTDVTPAKATATVGVNAIGNGKKIADLEWFCMGERGDQYRMAGYPNYIPTEYLVDPTKEYNVLELHYAFCDQGVNSYRSEKDITIVAEDKAELNKLIEAINTATKLGIATLTAEESRSGGGASAGTV